MTHLIANEFGDGVALERSDGGACVFEERVDQLFREEGNLPEVLRGRRGQEFGGGIAFAKGEDPAAGDVLGEQSEFGKRGRQEKVELIDEPGALPHDRLQATGHVAERALLGRQHLDGCGPFAQSIACGGAGFEPAPNAKPAGDDEKTEPK